MPDGIVFDIQRFCTHDGPGIRTVVFLKGCPLDCPWCHNPESKSPRPEILYSPTLCMVCGRCVEACENGAHTIADSIHHFDRSPCTLRLDCVDACPSGALEIAGRTMTVGEVMAEVDKDRVFYEESGGGVTLSGGEPLAQFEFARNLLQEARGNGLHTCVETCGVAPVGHYEAIVPLTDLFLWDVKDTDKARLKANTGAGLDLVLDNLRRVDERGGRTRLRCLLIDGVNIENAHLDRLAELSRSLGNCAGIELMRHHRLGDAKRARLGLPSTASSPHPPAPEQMREAAAWLADRWGIQAEVTG